MIFPESWQVVKISTVCDINPRLKQEERPNEDIEVTFVPMAAVDEAIGIISKPEKRTFGEVSKGYTSFNERDILFAKVTPCMENGKVAIANNLLNGLGFGSTEFHVLRPADVILPEFLFHFIRQPTFRRWAESSFVGTGGLQRVPPDFFKRASIPLPSLPEQQHIVDILKQAKTVAGLRNNFDELFARLKQQLFLEMFGDPNPKFNEQWETVKLGNFVTVGTGGTPSRAQADNFEGSLPWVKSTDLKDDLISSTEECVSELGIKRSNAKIYPKQTVLLAMYGQGQTRGRTAKLIIDAACNQACAALLPGDELLPDYLWAWLQLSYNSVRSLGRGGQQENLNLNIVRGIKLPKPPVPLQKEFSRRLSALLDLFKTSQFARKGMGELVEVIRSETFIGDATSVWRSQHTEEIASAAIARDELLRERGVKLKTAVAAPEPSVSNKKAIDWVSPARQWIAGELSEFQRQVLAAFLAYPEQPLIVEDEISFITFCDSDEVSERLQDFGAALNNQIRRTLSQLAALGLIAQVTLPKLNDKTGEREYLKAFRPLRETDFSRLSDIESIKRALNPQSEKQYYFFVHLDYETSESAGAGGMFQIISIRDEEGKDYTPFIDHGVHYSSLDGLKEDIASALKVSANQIELEEE